MKKVAVILYLLAAICVCYAIGIVMTKAAGTRFFLVWFGIAGMMIAAGAFFNVGIWYRMPGIYRIGLAVLTGIVIFFFLLIEGRILSGFHAKASEGLPYIVVLGAQMKQNGPSVALARRLDAAAVYMEENPDTLCVVSGGQGSNEPVSEAEGMYQYLTAKGIEAERIIKEDRSCNTFENLEYARKLIPDNIERVGIVTSNFHVYRAVQLSKLHGFLDAEGIGAGSGMYFLPNNMLREFFGVVKDWVFNGMMLW